MRTFGKRHDGLAGHGLAAAGIGLLAATLWCALAGVVWAQNGQPPAAAATPVPPPAAAPAAPAIPVTTSPAPPAAPAAAAPAAPAVPVAASPAPENPAPAQGAALSFPPQPPPPNKPGFITAFGHWWTDSVADFNTKMKDAKTKMDAKQDAVAKDAAAATRDAMKDAAKATQEAATAVVRLPSTRVLEMRELCATAPNGAPDCQSAAKAACRRKGFADGRALDVSSAEKCKASLWLSGQPPAEGDCPVETVVLRAICQ